MPKVSPAVQGQVVHLYNPNKRGCGYMAVANQLSLPISTVKNIIKRSKQRPTDFSMSKPGRKRVLKLTEVNRITSALEKNPILSNVQLAILVHNKISPQTVSKYLKRENVPFVRRRLCDVEPEEYTADWRLKACEYLSTVKTIPLAKRVYEDETGIFDNDAPKFGRVRKGSYPLRIKSRYGTKRTLHIWVERTRVLHWELRKNNANNHECCVVGLRAIKKINSGQTIIWDRLGKSGRCQNPTSQHFNPILRRAMERKNINMIHLPPKGKYFNPVELLIGDLKQHFIRPKARINGKRLSQTQLKKIINKYMIERAPNVLPSFFRERAGSVHANSLGLI